MKLWEIIKQRWNDGQCSKPDYFANKKQCHEFAKNDVMDLTDYILKLETRWEQAVNLYPNLDGLQSPRKGDKQNG